MELFGGMMVMMWILFFFLSVVWFVLPFVIFSMKGKVDRSLELLETIDRRLAALEAVTTAPPLAPDGPQTAGSPHSPPSGSPQPAAGE